MEEQEDRHGPPNFLTTSNDRDFWHSSRDHVLKALYAVFYEPIDRDSGQSIATRE